jgi:hypothetical protein
MALGFKKEKLASPLHARKKWGSTSISAKGERKASRIVCFVVFFLAAFLQAQDFRGLGAEAAQLFPVFHQPLLVGLIFLDPVHGLVVPLARFVLVDIGVAELARVQILGNLANSFGGLCGVWGGETKRIPLPPKEALRRR